MPEKEFTKKLTSIIKDADKLVQDIERDARKLIQAVMELKKLGKDDESDR